jgi:hypothetical protein
VIEVAEVRLTVAFDFRDRFRTGLSPAEALLKGIGRIVTRSSGIRRVADRNAGKIGARSSGFQPERVRSGWKPEPQKMNMRPHNYMSVALE